MSNVIVFLRLNIKTCVAVHSCFSLSRERERERERKVGVHKRILAGVWRRPSWKGKDFLLSRFVDVSISPLTFLNVYLMKWLGSGISFL